VLQSYSRPMTLDRTALRISINDLYRREHEELGDSGTYAMLEEASQWDVSQTLGDGGVVVRSRQRGHCGLQCRSSQWCARPGCQTVLAKVSSMRSPRRWNPLDVMSPPLGVAFESHDGGYRARARLQRRGGETAMRSLRHFWEAR
jgi:hypothetical protein